MTDGARPGALTPWQYVQNVLFYVHVACATLIIGLFGLPALRHGRAGANRIATRWIAYMVWAARIHLRLTCEIRGTPPTHDCIVAAKHQSFWDIMVIAHAVPRRAFIMKREVMRVRSWAGTRGRPAASPSTGRAGRDAMAAISSTINQRLSAEGLGQLIIYPEGTRTCRASASPTSRAWPRSVRGPACRSCPSR